MRLFHEIALRKNGPTLAPSFARAGILELIVLHANLKLADGFVSGAESIGTVSVKIVLRFRDVDTGIAQRL